MTSKTRDDSLYAVWFTPGCIRDHFDGDTGPVSDWVEKATDEQLYDIAEAAISWDSLWELFHRILVEECSDAAGIPQEEW